MFKTISSFRKIGILNINTRNSKYIFPYNQRKNYKYVDNKFLTKQLAIEHNLPVPKLYGHITGYNELKLLKTIANKYNKFVIKPTNGYAGNGILIVKNSSVNLNYINYHTANILSGMYSIANHHDTALIEAYVTPDNNLQLFNNLGVPDIRIIIFKGTPIMAMLRLPTSISKGKANLHQGAIGIGINLDTGQLTSAIWKNKIINTHPDLNADFNNFIIHNWQKILLLAQRCYKITSLGYIGVDIVIDNELGPLLLEINARPGLTIQLANKTGLLKKLANIS